jgi:RHS repeat-associated protein
VLSAEIFSYDPMGRVVSNSQCAQSNCGVGAFTISNQYDLAGDLTSTTDGAGTTISYAYGLGTAPITGRLTAVTSSLNDAQHPAALYSGVGYYPHGAVQLATFGNGLSETSAYNSRLQPCRMELNSGTHYFNNCGDAERGGNVVDFTMGYNAGATDNGNVASWSAAGNQSFNRTYTYDNVNRIKTMSDSVTTQPCQGMSWTIDAWGNMTNQTGTAGTCFNFSSSSPGTKNQLSGYTYDAAGNMINDGNHQYTYDAEGRITQVDGGGTASYVYNENGRRVRKNTGSTFTEYYYGPNGSVQGEWNGSSWPAEYVYAGGRLIAEYKGGTTEFIHPDHLGSTRLVTSVTGAVLDSLDYTAYGVQTQGDTSTTHKFTGKERDSESGLDYFGARHYASSIGRFMTPDPPDDDENPPSPVPFADFRDPQTLNLYEYVRNNPLNRVDLDGHKMTCTTDFNGNMHCVLIQDPQGPDYIGLGTLLNLLFVQPVEALYRSVNPPNCPRCLSVDWALGNVRPILATIRPDGRPAIVPKNWVEKSTRKGNGKIYIDPQNEHNRVRVMDDGYMKVQKNGQFLDVNGNVIPGPDAGDTTAAHIPVSSTMQSPFEDVTVVGPPEIELPPE